MVGVNAGSYRIVRQIGEGGMGAVYLGEHVILGRPAAIKVLHPELSQQREIVGRFFNEARAATAIRHPGIVEVYDFGYLSGGAAYIAMEFLEGESLASRLRREQRLSVAATIQIGRQIAAALQAAHGKAITHRDLKPDNVFLVPDPEIGERVKLLDFGIAKLASDDLAGSRTRTGLVMGTPVYMSPEQCRGAGTLDHRSDLYSLGCMLYELVAGRPPFVADGAGDIIAHHLYFQPEPVSNYQRAIPEPFERLIMSLLGKDPATRPPTAEHVVAILDHARGWDVGPAVRPSPAVYASPAASTRLAGASMPTTLSGSASAVPVPGVSARATPRRAVWFIAAGALAVGAVAVAVIATGGSGDAPASPDTTGAAVPPAAPAPAFEPMKASMERFAAWAQRHAGAPCPDAGAIGAAADPWGHAMRVTCIDQPGDQQIGLISAGPDGAIGTQDDVASWQLGRELTDLVRGPRWASTAPSPAARQPTVVEPATHAAQPADPLATAAADKAAPRTPTQVDKVEPGPAGKLDAKAAAKAAPSAADPAESKVAKVEPGPAGKLDAKAAAKVAARTTDPSESKAAKVAPRTGEKAESKAGKVDAKPPEKVDLKPAEPIEPRPAESAAAPPATGSATAAPPASKWGRLLGDKSPAQLEVEGLIKQCQTAAAKNDCGVARAIAGRIAEKDPAMYRERVANDATIRTCLRPK